MLAAKAPCYSQALLSHHGRSFSFSGLPRTTLDRGHPVRRCLAKATRCLPRLEGTLRTIKAHFASSSRHSYMTSHDFVLEALKVEATAVGMTAWTFPTALSDELRTYRTIF
jgi:hypothetical protein